MIRTRFTMTGIGVLLVIDIVLVCLHVFLGWSVINLDEEANLPAWYSSVKLAALAVLSVLLYRDERRRQPALRLSWLWLIIGGVFLFLSADETASLHERFSRFVLVKSSIGLDIREVFLGGDTTKDSFAWVLLLSPMIVGVVGLFLFFFVKRLTTVKVSFVTSMVGLALFISAVALEATIYATPSFQQWTQGDLRRYQFLIGFEECAEMVGTTCFLLSFAWFLVHHPRSQLA